MSQKPSGRTRPANEGKQWVALILVGGFGTRLRPLVSLSSYSELASQLQLAPLGAYPVMLRGL